MFQQFVKALLKFMLKIIGKVFVCLHLLSLCVKQLKLTYTEYVAADSADVFTKVMLSQPYVAACSKCF